MVIDRESKSMHEGSKIHLLNDKHVNSISYNLSDIFLPSTYRCYSRKVSSKTLIKVFFSNNDNSQKKKNFG